MRGRASPASMGFYLTRPAFLSHMQLTSLRASLVLPWCFLPVKAFERLLVLPHTGALLRFSFWVLGLLDGDQSLLYLSLRPSIHRRSVRLDDAYPYPRSGCEI